MCIIVDIFLLVQIFDYIIVGFHLNRQVLREALEESLFPESHFVKETYFFTAYLFFKS